MIGVWVVRLASMGPSVIGRSSTGTASVPTSSLGGAPGAGWGDTVVLTVLRGDQKLDLTVTLGARP